LAACTYADASPLDAKLVLQTGASMWVKRGNNRSEDASEILSDEPFFNRTYATSSWQCSERGVVGTAAISDISGELERAPPSGVVITDGIISFAGGRGASGEWFIFDSHPPNARQWRMDSRDEWEATTVGLLVRATTYDCTVFNRRRPQCGQESSAGHTVGHGSSSSLFPTT
jgi:hypothetical protein